MRSYTSGVGVGLSARAGVHDDSMQRSFTVGGTSFSVGVCAAYIYDDTGTWMFSIEPAVKANVPY